MPLSEQVYNIGMDDLTCQLTPKSLRQPKRMIFFKSIMGGGLLWFLNTFLFYRQAKLYQIAITPQVCYLEKLLNDRYDFTQRRIVIKDTEWQLPVFIYKEAENKPAALFTESEAHPVTLWTDAEAGDVKDDFIVTNDAAIPSFMRINEDEMRSLLDGYKLFGTRYKIQMVYV